MGFMVFPRSLLSAVAREVEHGFVGLQANAHAVAIPQACCRRGDVAMAGSITPK